MIPQLKAAKVSYWNNKWNEVYDFTPNKVVSKGLNYKVSQKPSPGFVVTMNQMKKIIAQIE
jgi:hypothetical protein